VCLNPAIVIYESFRTFVGIRPQIPQWPIPRLVRSPSFEKGGIRDPFGAPNWWMTQFIFEIKAAILASIGGWLLNRAIMPLPVIPLAAISLGN